MSSTYPFNHNHAHSRMDLQHGSGACVASAASLVDVLVPPIMEEIVKIVKTVLQEQISERIRKQIDDVFVPQIVDQVTEVPKTSNCERTSQRAVEQIFDVPVPEMVNQLVEALEDRFPKTESGSGLWSRSLTLQSRRSWKNWRRASRFSPRTGFNSALWSRSSKILLIQSLR